MLVKNNYEDLVNLDDETFVFKLVSDIYPQYFKLLSHIREELNPIYNEPFAAILSGIYQKIVFEWDEMFRKEKFFLFPYLVSLKKENKKAESAKAFNYVKPNYTSLLFLLKELKLSLNPAKELLLQNYENILQEIEVFEHNITKLQTIKEETIYSKYYKILD